MFGGYFNKYPYSNFHDLNLDYILDEVKKMRSELDEWETKVLAKANAYTDEEILKLKAELLNALNALEQAVNTKIALMQQDIDTFKQAVTILLAAQDKKIDDAIQMVTERIAAFEMLIDLKIEQNNKKLIEELQEGLANILVINYFTGEKVTIQAMFDYLCMLHLQDAITYDELAARKVTYDNFIAAHFTYTQLIAQGKIVVPQGGRKK